MRAHRVWYRRRLPHYQPIGGVFFVTARLAGTLPERRDKRSTEAPEDAPDWLDALADDERALDADPRGRWLANAAIAEVVRAAIAHQAMRTMHVHRYVIMPNHLHLLFEPLEHGDTTVAIGEIMRALKSYTGHVANRLLGRQGAFWQEESFDRCVRHGAEYARTIAYIDANPVVAGLCATPEQWAWSSTGDGGAVPHAARADGVGAGDDDRS